MTVLNQALDAPSAVVGQVNDTNAKDSHGSRGANPREVFTLVLLACSNDPETFIKLHEGRENLQKVTTDTV
jgi:hypothetical protein